MSQPQPSLAPPDGDRFAFSHLPNYLEWYECYEDLSNDGWLDGQELYRNKGLWDAKTISKWNFFYRPYPPAIGRPQKKMIGERQATIKVSEKYSSETQSSLAEQRESIRKAQNFFLAWASAFALIAIAMLANDSVVIPFFLVLSIGIGGKKLFTRIAAARAVILQSEKLLAEYSEGIRKSREEIRLLEQEISNLHQQIPSFENAGRILSWLDEELMVMERECLSEFVGDDITSENIRQYLPQDFGDPRVSSLLIDSWGALQPTEESGPMGAEARALSKIVAALQNRMVTWQVGVDDQPIFRVWFLQYVMPLERNLNICSFFYDFIARRCYGKRYETFQYNHVTNYSIREVEPSREVWVKKQGLDTISALLRGKELRALTIAVASGNHFRCALVDNDVVDVLNQLIQNEEKYRAVLLNSVSDDELQRTFHGNEGMVRAWKDNERTRVQEDLQEYHRVKRSLRQTSRSTKAILNSVRSCIERYVLSIQQPA